jgi:heme/copper-type cytochrome/quinol oxidase subunit 2
MNAARLGSIKTEVLVAEIFAILAMVGFVAIFAMFAGFFSIAGVGSFGVCTLNGENVPCSEMSGIFAAIGLILGIIFLIPAIISIFVVRRTNSMRSAADRGDIARLKDLNSTGWAIVALLFTGIIPGIMLLIAHGPIAELTTSS